MSDYGLQSKINDPINPIKIGVMKVINLFSKYGRGYGKISDLIDDNTIEVTSKIKINTDPINPLNIEAMKVVNLLSKYGRGCGRINDLIDENAIEITSKIKIKKSKIRLY